MARAETSNLIVLPPYTMPDKCAKHWFAGDAEIIKKNPLCPPISP